MSDLDKALLPVSPSLSEPDSDPVWWSALDSEPLDLVSSVAWSLDLMSGCFTVAALVSFVTAWIDPVVRLDPVTLPDPVIRQDPVIWLNPVPRFIWSSDLLGCDLLVVWLGIQE